MANTKSNAQIIKNFSGEFEVVIQHNDNSGVVEITPIVKDGVRWETDRQGSAGKLTCTILANDTFEFQEGDAIYLRFKDSRNGWITAFYGYVFTKKRSKDGWIDVTAYDLLRYLKNKTTMVYENKRASDIVNMIAKDYHLGLGTIEVTNYVIGERVEDDQTLFDIIQNALDLTVDGTSDNKLYVLYSKENKLCLESAEKLQLDVVINKSTAEDFEYSSSIDNDTYNEVELFYDNDNTNQREYYRAFDSNNMNKWGRLRYTQNVQTPSNINERVKNTLKLYNRKKRELKVMGAFGDYRCRAGASVIVDLDLGDVKLSNYMLIEKATHTFSHGEYLMDLTLSGSWNDETYGDDVVNQVEEAELRKLKVNVNGNYGTITAIYYNVNNVQVTLKEQSKSFEIECYKNSTIKLYITPNDENCKYSTSKDKDWKNSGDIFSATMDKDKSFLISWTKKAIIKQTGIPLDECSDLLPGTLRCKLNGISCLMKPADFQMIFNGDAYSYGKSNIGRDSAFVYDNQVFVRCSGIVLSAIYKIYPTDTTRDFYKEVLRLWEFPPPELQR